MGMLTSVQTVLAAAAAITASIVGIAGLSAAVRQYLVRDQICMVGNAAFFERTRSRCFKPIVVAALSRTPLVDGTGDSVTVDLSHPFDPATAPATVNNCSAYGDHKHAGWNALTSRDLSREGYFVRACGTLAALQTAIRPKA